jgi:hypothetical protein
VPSVRVGQDAEIVVLRQRCEFSNVNSTDVSAVQTLGAVVVLEEEWEAGVGFGPDAVAVGADDLTPLPGTAPFGPPLLEPVAEPGAGGAEQGAEEPVQTDEMREALAGGEVVDEAPSPRQIGEVEPGLGRYEGGTGITELAFDRIDELATIAWDMMSGCDCESGCPRCVYDRSCGSGNEPKNRLGAVRILASLQVRPAGSVL